MAKKAKPFQPPKYCLHKASGRGYAKHKGNRVYFGKHGTDESVEAYNRWVGQLLAGEPPIEKELDPSGLTVNELAAAYLQYAVGYYVKNGVQTSKVSQTKMVLRALLACHRTMEAKDFTPKELRSIQSRLIDEGRSRVNVNLLVSSIVRIFKWGVSRQLVDGGVYRDLQTVEGLRKGRTKAPELPPVQPVADSVVDATLEHLSEHVGDMVRLQRLSGARPGEICCLRPCDIDRSGDIWEYRPESHKTEHRDKERTIYFGPKAQKILVKYLLRPPESYCFPTQRSAHYSTRTYTQAIQFACDDAGVKRWSANQLRHTAATQVRKEFGLEAAQVALGHSQADTTQIYAEKNAALAREVAKRIG